MIKVFALATTILISNHLYANLKIGTKSININELEPSLRSEYFEIQQQNYKLERSFWEEVLFEAHVNNLAKEQGKSPEQIQEALLKVSKPTEKELLKFFEENRSKISYPFETIKSELENYVLDSKKREKKLQIVNELLSGNKAQINLKEPIAPVFDVKTSDFYQRGNRGSKVTLVEFADFKCPHCAHAAKTMDEVFEKYKDKVNFVFVDFPILKGSSEDIAKAAFCAHEQGAYWEFHKDIFANQTKVDDAYILNKVSELKLDKAKWDACRKSEKGSKIVSLGKAEGERLGIRGTPTFFLNGKRLNVSQTLENFSQALDTELKR